MTIGAKIGGAGKTAPPITDGNSPWNEAFSFTPEQYARLKLARPDLFDQELDAAERVKRWKAFAQSTEGKAFRWR
jgi:hypothetical protein